MKRHQFTRQIARNDRDNQDNPRRHEAMLQRLVRQAGAAYIINAGKITGYRLPDGTAVCRKRRYPSGFAASADLAQITALARNKHIPVRAYPCEHCRGFHLTSRA